MTARNNARAGEGDGRVDWTPWFKDRDAAFRVAAHMTRADTMGKALVLNLTFDHVERTEKAKGTPPLDIFYMITKVARGVFKRGEIH